MSLASRIEREIARIKGARPGPDYVWCDECMRWEWCGKDAHRLRRWLRARGTARAINALYTLLQKRVLFPLGEAANLAQIRDNKRRGLLIEEPPKEKS